MQPLARVEEVIAVGESRGGDISTAQPPRAQFRSCGAQVRRHKGAATTSQERVILLCRMKVVLEVAASLSSSRRRREREGYAPRPPAQRRHHLPHGDAQLVDRGYPGAGHRLEKPANGLVMSFFPKSAGSRWDARAVPGSPVSPSSSVHPFFVIRHRSFDIVTISWSVTAGCIMGRSEILQSEVEVAALKLSRSPAVRAVWGSRGMVPSEAYTTREGMSEPDNRKCDFTA